MYCPCRNCLVAPACRYKSSQTLMHECESLKRYLFRYIQDTAPEAIGGYNDRWWVIAKILRMKDFFPVHRNDKAIEIMMETGNDNPISLRQQITHLEEVQRMPPQK